MEHFCVLYHAGASHRRHKVKNKNRAQIKRLSGPFTHFMSRVQTPGSCERTVCRAAEATGTGGWWGEKKKKNIWKGIKMTDWADFYWLNLFNINLARQLDCSNLKSDFTVTQIKMLQSELFFRWTEYDRTNQGSLRRKRQELQLKFSCD